MEESQKLKHFLNTLLGTGNVKLQPSLKISTIGLTETLTDSFLSARLSRHVRIAKVSNTLHQSFLAITEMLGQIQAGYHRAIKGTKDNSAILDVQHSNSSQSFNQSLGEIFNVAMPLSENFLSLPLSLPKSHYITQDALDLLGSNNPPASVHQVALRVTPDFTVCAWSRACSSC